MIVPKFTESEQEAGNTDFNDLAKLRPAAVKQCLVQLAVEGSAGFAGSGSGAFSDAWPNPDHLADGVELFSLGQSSPPDGDAVVGTPVTYMLGFKDVGSAGEPPQVPIPGVPSLFGLGLAGLGWSRRKK